MSPAGGPGFPCRPYEQCFPNLTAEFGGRLVCGTGANDIVEYQRKRPAAGGIESHDELEVGALRGILRQYGLWVFLGLPRLPIFAVRFGLDSCRKQTVHVPDHCLRIRGPKRKSTIIRWRSPTRRATRLRLAVVSWCRPTARPARSPSPEPIRRARSSPALRYMTSSRGSHPIPPATAIPVRSCPPSGGLNLPELPLGEESDEAAVGRPERE